MDVDLSSQIAAFNEFFTSIYKSKIDDLLLVYPTQKSLFISYAELEKFDPDLADALVHTPDIIRDAAEEAMKQLNRTITTGKQFAPNVRFTELPTDTMLIEQLSSKNINELVAFKAVVTKRAEVMHRVKIATYKCELCDAEVRLIVGKNFTPPKRCDTCKKFALKQIDEDSTFTDIQRAEVQELLEKVRGGAPAAHIELLLEDDLVNKVAPGDNIEVAGILRLRPPLKMKQKQEMVYSRFVEVNSVASLKRDFEEIDITKEDEHHIRELAKNPTITNIVTKSIAPSIYGHNEVKLALALQLFGGTHGKTMKGGMPIRDDIHVLLIGDPGIAKCTDGDSKVLLADGSVAKIRDIVEEVLREKGGHSMDGGVYAVSNHDIVSMNLCGRTEQSKATHFWKLEAPEYLYEVETASGKDVKVTPEHPFFVPLNGYVKPKAAKELAVGEFIATPHYIKVDGKPQTLPKARHGKTNANRVKLPETLDGDFARLLGYLAGDGYLRRTTSYEINFTNSDDDLLNDFSQILRSLALDTGMIRDKESTAKTMSAFSVELGQILEGLGMMKDSFGKTVPQIVMKSPDKIVKEFIKAYFDCEASVGKEGLTVVSASKELLEDVQLLLLRFGIISQIHQTYSRATNAKNHKLTRYYRMFILGENAARYGELISFTSKEKARKLKRLGKRFNTNIDIVPGLATILKETRESLGVSQFHCGVPRSTYQHFERGDRNPSYGTLRRVVDAFTKSLRTQSLFPDGRLELASHNISVLETLCKSHIFWDKVKNIRKVKPTGKWVYDLQVDSCHNFIANNLMIHNSRFLLSVSEIAPKSIYVSGKSVSGAGMTVSAEKDELGEGGWTLKAGALVLASGGTAQVDEFDKIKEEDTAALHEAMETQSISVAKAGIVAKFRTKTAILAAANPKYGRFDQSKNLADQFNIPPTLLSRFDLIFPIVDVLDEEKDAKLAEHILSTHMGTEVDDAEVFDKILLRKYISYARRRVFPKLTNESSRAIKEFYVELRRGGRDTGSVAITPRYLEGLVRLAEAHAKIRLSDTVDEGDSKVAIDLFKYVMQQIMTDKATGRFDVDVVATGHSKTEREKLEKVDTIMNIIREHLRKSDTADMAAVVSDAASYDIDEATARKLLAELLRKGEIYEKEHGHIRIVGE